MARSVFSRGFGAFRLVAGALSLFAASCGGNPELEIGLPEVPEVGVTLPDGGVSSPIITLPDAGAPADVSTISASRPKSKGQALSIFGCAVMGWPRRSRGR